MSKSLRIARGACIIAQHKPYSLLSPSTRVVGNKRFAIDLLTLNNLHGEHHNGEVWSERKGDPRDLPGLRCAGRLDSDSQGLLVWTDDAKLQQHIIQPQSPIEKEYLVRVSNHAQWSPRQMDETMELMRNGSMHLDGEPLLPARVKQINEEQLQIVLTEGRNRQIRRMCALVGLEVEGIKRVRVGGLKLASIGVGYWSPLNTAQAARLLLQRADAQDRQKQRQKQQQKQRQQSQQPFHWRSDNARVGGAAAAAASGASDRPARRAAARASSLAGVGPGDVASSSSAVFSTVGDGTETDAGRRRRSGVPHEERLADFRRALQQD